VLAVSSGTHWPCLHRPGSPAPRMTAVWVCKRVTTAAESRLVDRRLVASPSPPGPAPRPPAAEEAARSTLRMRPLTSTVAASRNRAGAVRGNSRPAKGVVQAPGRTRSLERAVCSRPRLRRGQPTDGPGTTPVTGRGSRRGHVWRCCRTHWMRQSDSVAEVAPAGCHCEPNASVVDSAAERCGHNHGGVDGGVVHAISRSSTGDRPDRSEILAELAGELGQAPALTRRSVPPGATGARAMGGGRGGEKRLLGHHPARE